MCLIPGGSRGIVEPMCENQPTPSFDTEPRLLRCGYMRDSRWVYEEPRAKHDVSGGVNVGLNVLEKLDLPLRGLHVPVTRKPAKLRSQRIEIRICIFWFLELSEGFRRFTNSGLLPVSAHFNFHRLSRFQVCHQILSTGMLRSNVLREIQTIETWSNLSYLHRFISVTPTITFRVPFTRDKKPPSSLPHTGL